MKIPKYVQELLMRSRYEYYSCLRNENYAAGYTISVRKSSDYTKIETLKSEVDRLVKWANKNGGAGTAYVLYMPEKTHYVKQSAIVTIFDPVMQNIEDLIPEGAIS